MRDPGNQDDDIAFIGIIENSNVDCRVLKRMPALAGEGSRYHEFFPP